MIVDIEVLYAAKWFSRASKSKQEWADAEVFAMK